MNRIPRSETPLSFLDLANVDEIRLIIQPGLSQERARRTVAPGLIEWLGYGDVQKQIDDAWMQLSAERQHEILLSWRNSIGRKVESFDIAIRKIES